MSGLYMLDDNNQYSIFRGCTPTGSTMAEHDIEETKSEELCEDKENEDSSFQKKTEDTTHTPKTQEAEQAAEKKSESSEEKSGKPQQQLLPIEIVEVGAAVESQQQLPTVGTVRTVVEVDEGVVLRRKKTTASSDKALTPSRRSSAAVTVDTNKSVTPTSTPGAPSGSWRGSRALSAASSGRHLSTASASGMGASGITHDFRRSSLRLPSDTLVRPDSSDPRRRSYGGTAAGVSTSVRDKLFKRL